MVVTNCIWCYIVIYGSHLCYIVVYCNIWQLSVLYGSVLWYIMVNVVNIVTSFQKVMIDNLPYVSHMAN